MQEPFFSRARFKEVFADPMLPKIAWFLVLLIAFFGTGAYLLRSEIVTGYNSLTAAVLPGTLLSLTNADRATNGVGALTRNTLLDQAAKLKADDMATRGYFAHITPEGKTPLSFVEQVGYHYKNVGENLGLNYEDASSVEAAWMNSPGHRENLLYKDFTEIGIGVSEGTYQGLPATFVVQIFATPAPLAAVAPAKAQPASVRVAAGSAPVSVVPVKPVATTAPVATTTNTAKIRELQKVIAVLQAELQRLTAELNSLLVVQNQF